MNKVDNSFEKKHSEMLSEIIKEIQEINRNKAGIDLSTVYHNLHSVFAQYASQISVNEFTSVMSQINDELTQTFDKRIDEKDENSASFNEQASGFEFLESFSFDVDKNLNATKSFLSAIGAILADKSLSEKEKQGQINEMSDDFEKNHGIDIGKIIENLGGEIANEIKSIISEMGDSMNFGSNKDTDISESNTKSFVEILSNAAGSKERGR